MHAQKKRPSGVSGRLSKVWAVGCRRLAILRALPAVVAVAVAVGIVVPGAATAAVASATSGHGTGLRRGNPEHLEQVIVRRTHDSDSSVGRDSQLSCLSCSPHIYKYHTFIKVSSTYKKEVQNWPTPTSQISIVGIVKFCYN